MFLILFNFRFSALPKLIVYKKINLEKKSSLKAVIYEVFEFQHRKIGKLSFAKYEDEEDG